MKSLLLTALLSASSASADYDFTIAHINDHHSSLDPIKSTLKLDGSSVQLSTGGFPRVAAAIKGIRSQYPNTLVLHAGDALTGSLYYTLFKGEADAALMNSVCFDAMAVGNHEFDDSDAGLANFIQKLHNGACQTPVLSANLQVAAGTPLEGLVTPYTVVEKGGQKIGIVGLTIALKTKESSNPLPTTELTDEKAAAERAIALLKKDGVNRIVLLTHYQYANEMRLAQSLHDVDVIVGGDSHDLLGDFQKYGLPSSGPYPTLLRNLDGDPVCVVTAWQYAQVVGELHVSMDDAGRVKSCGGVPHLLLDAAAVVPADPQLTPIAEDPAARQILNQYSEKVSVLAQEKIGEAAEDLAISTTPGASDITHVVAKAFLEASNRAQVSIQNAGGVRRAILKGDITIASAYELLPFTNTLYNLNMSGQEIRNVLEDALDYALNPAGSGGAYPYAYGLRYDVRLKEAKGQRIQNIEVKPKGETGFRPLNPLENLVVVTNDYIAGGKDGYLGFAAIDAARRENTYLVYTKAFIDFVKARGTLTRVPSSDSSTKSVE